MTMSLNPLYTMALTTGFLGSAHCIGMCGGIVTAFSLSIKEHHSKTTLFQVLYNVGRISTYTLIGAIAGFLGSLLAYANTFNGLLKFTLIASDIFIVLAGLGTAGLFSYLNILKLEFSGPVKVLNLLASRLSSVSPTLGALPLGLVMGFLPCGFAYAMVITAAQTTSSSSGAFVMLFFGVGTIPSLFLVGSAAHWFKSKARNWMLRGAGVGVAIMGLYNFFGHIDMMGWTLSGPLQFLCH